jgi:sugar-specific transcriptional regulator TrmB
LADWACFLEKEDQILIRLGLSKVQARIYYTLLRIKSGSSATIAQASTITRQQIYREMSIMVDLGLVEKIVGSPTKYQATPIETSLKILQAKKAAELSDLDQATKLFLKNYASIKGNQTFEETSHFVYASEKEIALNKYDKECANAQISIEAIGPALDTESGIVFRYKGFFLEKLKQGVQLRIVTEKLRKDWKILNAIRQLQRSPLFEIRELPEKPPVQLAMFDRKSVNIVVSDAYHKYADLWSDNASLRILAINYFDYLWEKASVLQVP